MAINTEIAIFDYTTILGDNNSGLSLSREKAYLTALQVMVQKSDHYHAVKHLALCELTRIDFDALSHIQGESSNRCLDIGKALRRVYAHFNLELPTVILPALKAPFDSHLSTLSSWLNDMVESKRGDWQCIVKPKTAESYRYQLKKLYSSKLFKKFKDENIDVIKSCDIESLYLLDATHGLATRKVALSMLKAIGKLHSGSWVALDDIGIPEAKKTPPAVIGQFISGESLDELVTCSPTLLHHKAGDRAQAMIAIIIGSLLSVDELRSLKFEDVDMKSITIRARGMEHNRVILPDMLMKPIRAWIDGVRATYPQLKITGITPLFFNPKPVKSSILRPLSATSIQKTLSIAIETHLGYAKQAREQRTGVGIYNLRVSSARRMYAEGFDSEKLSKLVDVRELSSFLHTDKALEKTRVAALDRMQSFRESDTV